MLNTKIVINEDAEWVKEFRESIKENNGYCPCSLNQSEETKCMCVEFKSQESGWCHCGLYNKIVEVRV